MASLLHLLAAATGALSPGGEGAEGGAGAHRAGDV